MKQSASINIIIIIIILCPSLCYNSNMTPT
uniref:Uncharacterized protein n=1 Tax=Rhizophora mucronata TaxID=61149 RepID=A0A2P2PZU8_RHIMU